MEKEFEKFLDELSKRLKMPVMFKRVVIRDFKNKTFKDEFEMMKYLSEEIKKYSSLTDEEIIKMSSNEDEQILKMVGLI